MSNPAHENYKKRLRAGPQIAGCAMLLAAAVRPSAAREGEWTASLDDDCAQVAGESAAADQPLFVSSASGSIQALARGTGKRIWRFETGVGLPSGGTQIIVVPNKTDPPGMLGAAIQGQEGRAGGMRKITATPVVDSGTVYVGSWDHKFYAVEAASGAPKWSFDAGLPITDDAVVFANRVIFATGAKLGTSGGADALVIALDTASGKQVWTFNTLRDVSGGRKWPSHPPVLSDSVVFVTNWNATDISGDVESATSVAHAIDASSGDARWSYKVSSPRPSPPTVTQKYVVFATSPRTGTTQVVLHVLDKLTGQLVQRLEGAGSNHVSSLSTHNALRPPVVVNDELALLATDDAVAAFELGTGRQRWRLTEPFARLPINQIDAASVALVITGDEFAPKAWHLYGIDLQTGQVRWSRRLPRGGRIHSVLDGAVYIDAVQLVAGASVTALNAADGKTLGTVWRNIPFSQASSQVCFGPVRCGDRVLLSTSLQEVFGERSSPGHLYSVVPPAPAR